MTDIINDNLILIGGKSAGGKTASLMYLNDPKNIIYLNCEAGKKPPFADKFRKLTVTNPAQVTKAFKDAEEHPKIHTIIVDTLTFLMNMYESQHVLTATGENKFKAWADYAEFFQQKLMQDVVAKSTKNVIILAHTSDLLSESENVMETLVKVKGSTMNQGVEAYFCSVVTAKKIALNKLEKYKNKYLDITPEDEILGFKYVFQTRLTKESVHERIRGPIGMWSIDETFIDNNAQYLLDKLHEYYK